jgi:hypothetical protein
MVKALYEFDEYIKSCVLHHERCVTSCHGITCYGSRDGTTHHETHVTHGDREEDAREMGEDMGEDLTVALQRPSFRVPVSGSVAGPCGMGRHGASRGVVRRLCSARPARSHPVVFRRAQSGRA